MSTKLVFSRTQLMAVFKDFNTVKEFERLVAQANAYESLAENGVITTLTIGGYTLTIVKGIIVNVAKE